MKNIFALILALTLALAGCNTAPSAPEFADMYQLTTAVMHTKSPYQTGYISVPARFNPASGEITTLCADPLCSHGYKSGCPLEGYNGQKNTLNVIGNKVCFAAERYIDGVRVPELVCYDITSGTSSVAVSYDQVVSRVPAGASPGQLVISFKMGYYYLMLEDAETNEQLVFLRYDAKTGKVSELDPALDYGKDMPSFKYGEEYIYYGGAVGGVSDSLYIADNIDGEDKELLISAEAIAIAFDDLLDEDILLYATVKKNDSGRYDWENMTLHAFDMKVREGRVLVDPIPDVYIAAEGGYIYLVLSVEDPPSLGVDLNSKAEKYNRSGGILWRVNIETGEREAAFEAPEYCLERTNIEAVGKYIIIGYRNTDYVNYTVESTSHGDFYDYKTELGRIVYDTETGEYTVYHEGEERLPSGVINFEQ